MSEAARGRICVAMSGGVDSAVAAGLLVEQGYAVVGVTLRLFCSSEFGTRATACCSAESIRHAADACEVFGIPHVVLDEKSAFRASVIVPFAEGYARGETPIPCVACNTDVKFGSLFHRIGSFGATAIATGHYARIDGGNGTRAIRRPADLRKDQTYFLWGLDRARLGDVLFPLGDLTKDDVRARARAWNLPMADAAESQDICFVAGRRYADVVLDTLAESDAPAPVAGALVDAGGRVVGEHRGVVHYTIGQRRGLGVNAGAAPAYVVDIDAATNTVVIGGEEDLLERTACVRDVNWLRTPPAPGATLRALAQIRYKHTAAPVTIETRDDGGAVLRFDDPQRAITPGQSAVLYDGDRVMGGGVIARRTN